MKKEYMHPLPENNINEKLVQFNKLISKHSTIEKLINKQKFILLNNDDEKAIEYQNKMEEMIRQLCINNKSLDTETIVEEIMDNYLSSIVLYEKRAFEYGFVSGYEVKKSKQTKE